MKIEWEEIYNNSNIKNGSDFEATYRAKVIGGWLIRHETCCDYQYGCNDNCYGSNYHRHIEEEGHQNINNVITFISDPNHDWGKDMMAVR